MRAACNFYTHDHGLPNIKALAAFALSEPEWLDTYLTQPQAHRLIQHNPLLNWFVRLSLATGLRSGQLLRLRWDNINFDRALLQFHGPSSKTRKILVLPLSSAAQAALLEVREAQTLARYTGPWVFAAPGTQTGHILSLKKSFHLAKTRAALPHLRIHDLRHTYASWLVQRGVPIYTVQRLLGHSRIESTVRYAHLDVEHLRQFIDKDLLNTYNLQSTGGHHV